MCFYCDLWGDGMVWHQNPIEAENIRLHHCLLNVIQAVVHVAKTRKIELQNGSLPIDNTTEYIASHELEAKRARFIDPTIDQHEVLFYCMRF